MYVVNDLIFYRIVFIMQKMYYLNEKEFRSREDAIKFLDWHSWKYNAMYTILFFLNLYNALYIHAIRSEDFGFTKTSKQCLLVILCLFNIIIFIVHCFMTTYFYRTFMNFFITFTVSGHTNAKEWIVKMILTLTCACIILSKVFLYILQPCLTLIWVENRFDGTQIPFCSIFVPLYKFTR